MGKYTREFRIKLIMKHLSRASGGIRLIAKKYDIPKTTLENWLNRYNSGRFDNPSKKRFIRVRK